MTCMVEYGIMPYSILLLLWLKWHVAHLVWWPISEGGHRLTDTHDSNICAQKLNRNRTFFNFCTFSWTLDFKTHFFIKITSRHNYIINLWKRWSVFWVCVTSPVLDMVLKRLWLQKSFAFFGRLYHKCGSLTKWLSAVKKHFKKSNTFLCSIPKLHYKFELEN